MNDRVSCAVSSASGRSSTDELQVYLSPVVLDVELWYETINAGRKVGMEALLNFAFRACVELKVPVIDCLRRQT
jgi:hypothetical protein